MYCCGPTVYDLAHLGHGRSAVAFDIIRKYFVYRGYSVQFVSNITDIDDKMINRAAEEKISVAQLAEKIIPEYAKDYQALGVMAPDVTPRATQYIPQMITLIQKLENKSIAYPLEDGIYFDISKFPEYGKLSHQKIEELHAGARIATLAGKRNHNDFVLWKKEKPGEPAWDSPWGRGRPGWHIECSAMTEAELGQPFDIHGGGLDLIFPHHEDEIAQSESALDKPFAKYWLHNGYIMVQKEKMSKSLGNFTTLRDIFKKYHPRAVRLLYLQTHYRSPIDFTETLLTQAANSLTHLWDAWRALEKKSRHTPQGLVNPATKELIQKTKKEFVKAMDNDFDTAGALAVIFTLIHENNKQLAAGTLSAKDAKILLAFYKKIDAVLGILQPEKQSITDDIATQIAKRNAARAQKDFAKADTIRAALLKNGIVLEDSPEGTTWKKI